MAFFFSFNETAHNLYRKKSVNNYESRLKISSAAPLIAVCMSRYH